jgi:hypothetical protein
VTERYRQADYTRSYRSSYNDDNNYGPPRYYYNWTKTGTDFLPSNY